MIEAPEMPSNAALQAPCKAASARSCARQLTGSCNGIHMSGTCWSGCRCPMHHSAYFDHFPVGRRPAPPE
jgi:hypothetical protein